MNMTTFQRKISGPRLTLSGHMAAATLLREVGNCREVDIRELQISGKRDAALRCLEERGVTVRQ